MGVSGRMAMGVQDALLQLIAQRKAEEQFAEELRARQVQEQLAQQGLAQRAKEHTDELGFREKQLGQTREIADLARRDRSNEVGLRQMNEDREAWEGEQNQRAVDALVQGMPEGAGRRVVELKRRGINIGAEDAMTPEERKGEEDADVTRAGRIADAQARAAARYRAPSAGSDERQWLMREGQEVFDVYRPGDTRATNRSTQQETSQDRQRVARVQAAHGFLDRLNTLREKINTNMGPKAGLTGLVRRGAANVGMDPDVAEYERERAAAGRALAVAIMGAQNLSDADAKAWADMLPGATVDRETAQRLMTQVETMLTGMGDTMIKKDGARSGGSVVEYVRDPKTGKPVRKQ